MKCQICNFKSDSPVGIAQHVIKLHKINFLDYKLKYENFLIPSCDCGKQVKIVTKFKGIKLAKTCGNTECIKNNQRNAMLSYMKANPDKTAWRLSNLSYPEKIFKNKCEELKLSEKYLIIRERSFFPYFIDFAFENEKVAVEIDGSQHNLKERVESDLKKDASLVNAGWRVIRFTAKEIQINTNLCFEKLFDFIISDLKHDKVGFYEYKDVKKDINPRKRKKKTQRINKRIKLSKNTRNNLKILKKQFERDKNGGMTDAEIQKHIDQRKVNRPPYNQLIQEIKELGYLKTGRKYSVSDNSIRKWVKAYEKFGI